MKIKNYIEYHNIFEEVSSEEKLKGFDEFLKKIYSGSKDEDLQEYKELFLDLGYTEENFKEVGSLYLQYPTVFKDGVPFPGDDEIYDAMRKTDNRAKLLQKMLSDSD